MTICVEVIISLSLLKDIILWNPIVQISENVTRTLFENLCLKNIFAKEFSKWAYSNINKNFNQ